jgi:hypothetical protein
MKHLICLRCGHVFQNKANLNKHYKRIYICDAKYYNHGYQYLLKNHQQLKFKRLKLIHHLDQTNIKINKISTINDKMEILFDKINQINQGNTDKDYNTKSKYCEPKINKSKKDIYKCFCGKIYYHQSSLSRHKKSVHDKKTTLISQILKTKTQKKIIKN